VALVAPKGINCLKFSKRNKLNGSRRKFMGENDEEERAGREKEVFFSL